MKPLSKEKENNLSFEICEYLGFKKKERAMGGGGGGGKFKGMPTFISFVIYFTL